MADPSPRISMVPPSPAVDVSENSGGLRSTPLTQNPSLFILLTRWLPMNPPAPQTRAFFVMGFSPRCSAGACADCGDCADSAFMSYYMSWLMALPPGRAFNGIENVCDVRGFASYSSGFRIRAVGDLPRSVGVRVESQLEVGEWKTK
jgi:hypothetical protein